MKKIVSLSLFILSTALALSAQNPNYEVGPVWRVTYVHIKPGQGDAFWNDVRQHLKPIWEAQKTQHLISDYKLFLNATTNQPSDWNVAIGILYPNWAALDQLAAKGETIAAQHYGSRQAMIDAAKKRSDLAEVTASHLAREVTLK